MDALANGWVGSTDMARCRPERQRERANEGHRPYIFSISPAFRGVRSLLKTCTQGVCTRRGLSQLGAEICLVGKQKEIEPAA